MWRLLALPTLWATFGRTGGCRVFAPVAAGTKREGIGRLTAWLAALCAKASESLADTQKHVS